MGIQQTLTPATTTLSMKASGFAPSELSPLGSQDETKAFKTHPSDWTVDEVIDWLKSKGFDQSVCDKFIGTFDLRLVCTLNLTLHFRAGDYWRCSS